MAGLVGTFNGSHGAIIASWLYGYDATLDIVVQIRNTNLKKK
jgi:hypothetical protein